MGRVLSKKCRHLANNCVSPLLLNSHVQQVRSCLLLKRRIGNGNTRLRIAESLACSRNHYRAENLCYKFKQEQKLLPQFRKIVCLVFSVLCTQAEKQNTYSRRTYKRNMLIKRRNTSRNGGENMSAELDGCTVRLRRVVA